MHNFNSIDPKSLAHALVEPTELVWDQLKPKTKMGRQPKRVKLKKRYPGLRKDIEIGDEFVERVEFGDYVLNVKGKSPFHIHRCEVDGETEFWRDVTPTYRVINVKNPDTGKILLKWKNGKFGIMSGAFTLEELLQYPNKQSQSGASYDINSVQRLSDLTVFTLGDVVTYTFMGEDREPWKIVRFAPYSRGRIAAYGEGGGYCVINSSNFRHAKEVLFETEEGTSISEGDKYYILAPGARKVIEMTANKHGQYDLFTRRFASEEVAEDHVVRYTRAQLKKYLEEVAERIYDDSGGHPVVTKQEYKQSMRNKIIKKLEKSINGS